MTMHRTLTAFALASLLSLTACDTMDMTPEPPGPGPQATTVEFDWSGRIQIIEDCEVGGSNTGDFEFKVEVESTIDGQSSTRTVLDRDFAANTGTSVGVGGPTTYSVPAGASANFEVSFYAIENDVTSADDLDVTESIRHSLSNGVISPSGSQRINLSDGGNCEVELRYSASAS